MKNMLYVLLTACLLLTACQSTNQTQTKQSTQTIRPSTQNSWADDYAKLLSTNQKDKHPQYAQLYQELNAIIKQSGATYAYIIMPIKNGQASVDGNPRGDFMLTVDGSDDPDEWGETYGHEVQFTEAWQGRASVARSALDDDGEKLWSAFAPIYHNGKVIALLGMDYPVDDVIAKYPQWDRDDTRWNGFTDKITGKVPAEIQAKTQYIQTTTMHYATKLSRTR